METIRRSVKQNSMVIVRLEKMANLFGPRGVRYISYQLGDYVFIEKFYGNEWFKEYMSSHLVSKSRFRKKKIKRIFNVV